MPDYDDDEPLPSRQPTIPQHLPNATPYQNFVYRVLLHVATPNVAARAAMETSGEDRDVRAEINALYREHFPDSGKEASQTQTRSKDHDFSR